LLFLKTASSVEWKAVASDIKTLVEEATFEAGTEGLSFRALAKKLGWKWGLVVNAALCLGLAMLPLPAVVICTVSVLVAARNFQSAWLMHSLGEQRYRDFITHSHEGVWRIELEQPIPVDLPPDEAVECFLRHGYVAECNDAMARMYGYARAAEILGARLSDLMPRSDPKNIEFFRPNLPKQFFWEERNMIKTHPV
jgi:PAS domain-containing protein